VKSFLRKWQEKGLGPQQIRVCEWRGLRERTGLGLR